MSTPFNSLILAGFSGVGKDPLARMLAKDYPQVHNVKFSSLTKDILANFFRVPRSWLDGLDSEPKWREQPLFANGRQTKVTPLLLLQALYHGAPSTSLMQFNIEDTLAFIPKDSFPVFTDIRRVDEYEAVVNAGYNPLFIYLRRDDVKPGEADGEILSLAEHQAHEFLLLTKGREQENYSILKTRVQKLTTLTPAKPTLHVYVGCQPSHSSLDNYEPTLTVLEKTRAALESTYLLSYSVVARRTVDLFQALIGEANLSKLELAPITEDCYMVYNESYRPLLPRLREMARLLFYAPRDKGLLNNLDLTKQEWADANII